MNLRPALWLFLCPAILTGCAVQVHVGFESAADATATAIARSRATSTPTPELGTIAYVQGGDIWTKGLPDGRDRRLTQDGGNSWPSWSPSGAWLAFLRAQEIWLMRANGSDARALGPATPWREQMAWSPTADRLAYVSDGDLVMVDANDGHEVQVVSAPGGEGKRVQALAWSQSGAWLAYEALVRAGGKPPSEQGLWRVNANGRDSQKIYLNPSPAQVQSHLAAWSSDDKDLLFWQGTQFSASLAADGEPLMAVSASGGTSRRVIPIMLPYRSFLAWSPNGRTLAVIRGGGRQTWVNKDLLTVGLHGVSRHLSSPSVAEVDPAWSPNGKMLAVAAEPVGSMADPSILRAIAARRIWLIPANGSAPKQLTNDPSFTDEHPEWLHDGSTLLFARIHDQQCGLWLIRANGTALRQVVGELTPSPLALNYYGHIPWDAVYAYSPGDRASGLVR